MSVEANLSRTVSAMRPMVPAKNFDTSKRKDGFNMGYSNTRFEGLPKTARQHAPSGIVPIFPLHRSHAATPESDPRFANVRGHTPAKDQSDL